MITDTASEYLLNGDYSLDLSIFQQEFGALNKELDNYMSGLNADVEMN